LSTEPIFQHPLAYLLGLHGVALMRAFAGDFDSDFTLARLAEVRQLLDRAGELGDGVLLPAMSSADGYDGWAPSYDGDNPFFAMDEAQLLPVLDVMPPGMLAVARAKVRDAVFAAADMARLPLEDASVDVVVNTLALNHVEDLGPVFAEAARVLRPGALLLVADVRGYFVGSRRTPLVEWNERVGFGYIPAWSHPTGDYLRAAIAAGLVARDCQELVASVPDQPEDEDPEVPPPGEPASIWALHPWAPAAARAVRDDRVSLITWHFVRE